MAGLKPAIRALLACDDEAIRFFTRRDLCGEVDLDTACLWDSPAPQSILRRQQPDGSWLFPGAQPGLEKGEDYTQIETYRRFGQLVELYGFDARHAAISRAAEWLFTRQTSHGDFRGIYGCQYTPNYSAGILELLVKAGYENDERVENCFRWLLFMRQEDGGWAIPVSTRGQHLSHTMDKRALEPDRTKPFSHLVTGIVLRAFAAHTERRHSEPAKRAAHLLASRFFQRDRYPERGGAGFWLRPSFPFWYTDALSALDSLSLAGIGAPKALDWLKSRQRADGFFYFHLLKTGSVPNLDAWMTLAACRVLRRYPARADH